MIGNSCVSFSFDSLKQHCGDPAADRSAGQYRIFIAHSDHCPTQPAYTQIYRANYLLNHAFPLLFVLVLADSVPSYLCWRRAILCWWYFSVMTSYYCDLAAVASLTIYTQWFPRLGLYIIFVHRRKHSNWFEALGLCCIIHDTDNDWAAIPLQ